MKKNKKKVAGALKVAEFWLPYLNDFALESDTKPYQHPWLPVEVVREIARLLKADSGKIKAKSNKKSRK
jgi:hypothetical protein